LHAIPSWLVPHKQQTRNLYTKYKKSKRMWGVAILTAVAAVLLAYYFLKPKVRSPLAFYAHLRRK
jgi:type VI protein secretion system component VasF